MFTGIITDIGTIRHVEGEGTRRIVIATAYDADSIAIGASIACNGVCLTVVEKGTYCSPLEGERARQGRSPQSSRGGDENATKDSTAVTPHDSASAFGLASSAPPQGGSYKACFTVELAPETLARTTASGWREGTRLNLERALKLGEELGGHLVTGHVDGIATVQRIEEESDTHRLRLTCPPELLRFIAEKGSVTLDGVALTVTHTDAESFGVMLIPHTLAITTLGEVKEGAALNLEVDLIARYVARLQSLPC